MYASVYCTVPNQDKAEAIVDDLKDAGFSSNDISVLMQDRRGTREFATEHNTKAPEGATTGGVAGMTKVSGNASKVSRVTWPQEKKAGTRYCSPTASAM